MSKQVILKLTIEVFHKAETLITGYIDHFPIQYTIKIND